MVRSWLSLMLLLGLVCPAGAAYLERETLILDMTGSREVKTSRPLEEHKQYYLTMKSPYNLRPLWGALRECNCVKYLLLLDGQSPSDNDRVSPWDYGHDMTEITWQWWGKGTPLGLRMAKDLTSEIRHATVEISRVKDPASTPSEVAGREATPPLWKQSPASGNFLERETMALPTDGSAIHTTRPLEPYRMYAIRIRSPYNLYPLFHEHLQLDGRDVRADRPLTFRDPPHREQLELMYPFRGKGTQLTLRLSKNISDAVPHAAVEVLLDADGSLTADVPASPMADAETPSSPVPRAYGVSLLVIGVGLLLVIIYGVWTYGPSRETEEMARERARKQAEADQRAAEAARKQAELKAKAIPWIARAHAENSFVDQHFQRSYARSHTKEILEVLQDGWIADFQSVIEDEALYYYLRTHATQSVDVPAWLDARMAIIDLAKKAMVGLLPDDPLPPEPPTPEEAVREELRARARALQDQVELERNFLDPQFQSDYARKYIGEILAVWGREWFTEYQVLRADYALMALVQEEFPEVVAFYEARLEVLRIAQRLDVAPPPEKPRFTPEDHKRKVTNFRNRVLQWRQTKADDFIAQRVQQLEMLRAFEDELAQYELDEDERDRLLQEFSQELDLIEPPKPKGKADDDKEDGDASFATIRPDR